MNAPSEPAIVPRELLEQLAAEAPVSPSSPEPASSSRTSASSTNGRYTSRLLVDKWLADRGVAFRIKSEPDGKGRIVYVLAQCPFDPSHGDPDSCIMQGPDGKLSALCFHNSCRGRGWQAFKQAIGAPERHHYDPPLPGRQRTKRRARPRMAPAMATESGNPAANGRVDDPEDDKPAVAADGMPTIQGNQRQLRYVTADALEAILVRNNPPGIFQRGALLTRLRWGVETNAPYFEPLTDAALRGILTRVADWTKIRTTPLGVIVEEDAPPMEVVKDLAALPGWDGIPPIEAIVEVPVFTRQGKLIQTPGFHPVPRLWYHQAAGLVVPAVSPTPTTADVAHGRQLLLEELLGDFPFQDEASKAHALAALLLPFVRPLIDSPTPLHLLDAPVEGTGKTLLATVIAIVSTGREPEAIAEADSDEEWRKRITALLAEAPTFILLDNLNRVLDAGALASVLTTRMWRDRILGVSKTASLPNTSVWLASGNNTQLSREMIRRTVWCRLDAKQDAPWERNEFRHPNLIAWAKAQRGPLVGAALTLVQAWIAVGRPPGRQTLGMFESWAETLGGILDVAGVPGLLANARAFRSTHADKVGEWRAFVTCWWQEFGEQAVGVDKLFRLVTEQVLLDSVLGDKGERSQRIRLGLALGKATDRVFGDYRIERGEDDHKGRLRFRLRPVKAEPNEPAPGTVQWEA
jgi:hypothetical protein